MGIHENGKEEEVTDIKWMAMQVYRTFYFIEAIPREIKWAWQRVFRGWDDRVVWSIDIYLNKNMPLWLDKLKKTKQGVPVVMFPDDYSGNDVVIEKEDKEKWDRELDKMIMGFKANDNLCFVKCSESDEALWKEGIESFVKYYNNLWD